MLGLGRKINLEFEFNSNESQIEAAAHFRLSYNFLECEALDYVNISLFVSIKTSGTKCSLINSLVSFAVDFPSILF